MDNTNSPGPETSENLITLHNDLAHDLTAKSFRCTFCKRGFSNAQALGGHMNIHRKDRARLREFNSEDFLSLEISNSKSVDNWEESINIPPDSSPKEKSRVLGNDQSCDDDDDDDDQAESVKPPARLPFVGEAPPAVHGGDELGKHAERRLNHGELDLELRLGPEPPHHANSK